MKRYITLLTLLLLTACATLPSSKTAYNQNIPWPTRVKQLTKIKTWQLSGKVAVQLPQQSMSAYLNWQQQNKLYHLNLFGPLGIGAVNITGKPGQFILKNSEGETLTARSPEKLIEQGLGWRLPVSDLYFWIRGLPDPKLNSQKQFDRYHHLTTLKQNGWTIKYLRYTGTHGVDLPSQMLLSRPQLSLQLIIAHWNISS